MTRPKAARKLAPKTAPRSAVLLGLCLAAALTGCTAPAADAPAHETSAEEQAALEELSADVDSSAAMRDFAARLLSRCVDEDPERCRPSEESRSRPSRSDPGWRGRRGCAGIASVVVENKPSKTRVDLSRPHARWQAPGKQRVNTSHKRVSGVCRGLQSARTRIKTRRP